MFRLNNETAHFKMIKSLALPNYVKHFQVKITLRANDYNEIFNIFCELIIIILI